MKQKNKLWISFIFIQVIITWIIWNVINASNIDNLLHSFILTLTYPLFITINSFIFMGMYNKANKGLIKK